MAPRSPAPADAARFMAKVAVDGPLGCWIWTGYRHRGYARFSAGGRSWLAHRWAYVNWIDDLPADHREFVLDHYVCNRGADGCVNPGHLRVTTRAANGQWNGHARKLCCPSGHEYDSTNTYVDPKGHRRCRICAREGLRARRTQQ